MDAAELERWVTTYVEAWRSAGTDTLGGLFTEAVRYSASPWAADLVGLPALAGFWESERDGPDEPFEMTSEVVAVDGRTGVVRVSVDYPHSRWRDLWVVRLADDGRCEHFEEWPFAPEQPDGHA